MGVAGELHQGVCGHSRSVLSLCLCLSEAGKRTLPPAPEDFKSQIQSAEWERGGIGALQTLHRRKHGALEVVFPALTSQQLNLGDGERVQSGETSVPDDFLLLRSFSSALTPPPHLTYPAKCVPPTAPIFL
ncbi:hypothetical protein NQZ68_006187 [Dissostichus eleginoides]|nr:hypothetical protein NQZ68_006187 [Dissostichus eleginoides]